MWEVFCFYNLRKQRTFRDATTGSPSRSKFRGETIGGRVTKCSPVYRPPLLPQENIGRGDDVSSPDFFLREEGTSVHRLQNVGFFVVSQAIVSTSPFFPTVPLSLYFT